MKKSAKYLAVAVLAAGMLFACSSAFAATGVKGGACGVSSEGTCKDACGPYDNIISSITETGGNTCVESQQCCVPTYCGSNTTGIGQCVSANSCAYGQVGINTGDCVPPKLCCVIPRGADVNRTPTTETVISATEEGGNIFTGETAQVPGAAGPEGETGGLVPCTGLSCSLCDLFKLIKNIINFLLGIIFAAAAGFVAWGGVEIMLAGGDTRKVSSGRERMMVAVTGLAIALGAWVFIGTLLQFLTNSSSPLPWNEVKCSSKGLQFSPLTTSGNDSACTSKGGTCQATSVKCDGSLTPGLCLAPASKNLICCVPKSAPSSSGVLVPYCAKGTLTNIQSNQKLYCKLVEPTRLPSGSTICTEGTAFTRADGTVDGCGVAAQQKAP